MREISMVELLGRGGNRAPGRKGQVCSRISSIAANSLSQRAGSRLLGWMPTTSRRTNPRIRTGTREEEPWELMPSASKGISKRLPRMKHCETFWSNYINGKFSGCLFLDLVHWSPRKDGNLGMTTRTLSAS